VNYYNEIDPHAAQWLRQLISDGLIPDGHVDARSICDVQPGDLDGFIQCHFFAGIGGWPYALQLAGWPQDEPVWTGSCPCQPFSVAGKGKGTADERHLWPEFARLIAECRPATVFGEQVASAAGRNWLAGVRADLEGMGYAVGGADLCAAGASPEVGGWIWIPDEVDGGSWIEASAGPPHIRQRLYWVGQSDSARRFTRGPSTKAVGHGGSVESTGDVFEWLPVVHACECDEDGNFPRCGIDFGDCGCPGPTQDGYEYEERSDGLYARRLADSQRQRLEGHSRDGDNRNQSGRVDSDAAGSAPEGGWSDFRIIQCIDGRARRTQSGIHPLAHGVSGRVGLLRGYGNSIVPQVAAEFIKAFQDVTK
jgi:DNA (cytosine-5)-methyltransferase 1